jgi:hypothetical protein
MSSVTFASYLPQEVNYTPTTELNKEFSYLPRNEYQDLTNQALLYNILAIVSIVAFAVIAVGALTAASFFAPISIPIVLLGFSALIPVFKQYVYDYLRDQEASYSRAAELNGKAADKYDELSTTAPDALKSKFHTAITDDYLPIIANYETCREEYEVSVQAHQETEQRLNAPIQDFLQQRETQSLTHADRHRIIQSHALKMCKQQNTEEMRVLNLKVRAAWSLHLIHHPHFPTGFTENAHFYQLDPATRLLNQQSEESVLPQDLRDPFLGLADGTILSKRAVKLLSVEDLSLVFSRGGVAAQNAWHQYAATLTNIDEDGKVDDL